MATDGEREGRAVEEKMGAGDHVDAGGDHGGGVDERGDGRGALHGVGQPDVERKLRALAGRAQEQAKADGGEDAAGPCGAGGREQFAAISAKVSVPKLASSRKMPIKKAEVADAVDDEGLLAGAAAELLLEPEADEQIRRETDALPANEHEQHVAGEDEGGHEEEEEVQDS